MAKATKSTWALALMILAGIVIGSFIGYIVRDIPYLSLLNYGKCFSIGGSNDGTLRLDLGILILNFALTVKINIASIIGVIIAVIIYRKI